MSTSHGNLHLIPSGLRVTSHCNNWTTHDHCFTQQCRPSNDISLGSLGERQSLLVPLGLVLIVVCVRPVPGREGPPTGIAMPSLVRQCSRTGHPEHGEQWDAQLQGFLAQSDTSTVNTKLWCWFPALQVCREHTQELSWLFSAWTNLERRFSTNPHFHCLLKGHPAMPMSECLEKGH